MLLMEASLLPHAVLPILPGGTYLPSPQNVDGEMQSREQEQECRECWAVHFTITGQGEGGNKPLAAPFIPGPVRLWLHT